MSRIIVILSAIATLSSLSPAQPSDGPPKEMERFKKLVGHWSGSGTTRMADNAPEAPWTSKSTSAMILGGHFMRDDTIISIAGPMPMELAFLTIHAWDAIRMTHVVYTVGNTGEMQVQDLAWLDENTMVQQAMSHREGKTMLERWITRIDGDETSFEGHMLGTTGGLQTVVKGKMTRQKDAEPTSVTKVPRFPMVQLSDEMKKLRIIAGTYDVKGSWSLSPDQPKQKFSGTEVITPLFGGVVVTNETAGDGYEGFSATVWDQRLKCYRRLALSNWGIHHETPGFWAGKNELVHTFTGLMMGQNMVTRSVLMVDEHGKAASAHSHTMTGASKPFVGFNAIYTARP